MHNNAIMNMTLREILQILQEHVGAEIKSRPFTPDVPISVLKLSVRSTNCLASENIKTVRNLLAYTERDLMQIRHFGRVSLEEIKHELARYGYHLASNGVIEGTATEVLTLHGLIQNAAKGGPNVA
jgi:DNA-directed RNA polymerase subunit alpha